MVVPVFVCAFPGWAWVKWGKPFGGETVTSLIVQVGTPCLVFDTLTRLDLDLAQFGTMAGATVTAMTVMGLLAVAWLRLRGLDLPTFLPALMFPNAGNMGLPICLFTFGEDRKSTRLNSSH